MLNALDMFCRAREISGSASGRNCISDAEVLNYHDTSVSHEIRLVAENSMTRSVTGEHTITRMAVATEAEAEKQKGDNRTMGRKFTIPYGLYEVHGFISASLARQTGFSEEDLDLFWQALLNMFDHDRLAARGEMAPQNLIVFKHQSELGNAPAQKLFRLVEVEKNCGDKPPRSFADYTVKIGDAPNGVELIEML